jgi:hypothetical protein
MDRHARTLHVCVLDPGGTVALDQTRAARPIGFLTLPEHTYNCYYNPVPRKRMVEAIRQGACGIQALDA